MFSVVLFLLALGSYVLDAAEVQSCTRNGDCANTFDFCPPGKEIARYVLATQTSRIRSCHKHFHLSVVLQHRSGTAVAAPKSGWRVVVHRSRKRVLVLLIVICPRSVIPSTAIAALPTLQTTQIVPSVAFLLARMYSIGPGHIMEDALCVQPLHIIQPGLDVKRGRMMARHAIKMVRTT